jgi:hypothetical protein
MPTKPTQISFVIKIEKDPTNLPFVCTQTIFFAEHIQFGTSKPPCMNICRTTGFGFAPIFLYPDVFDEFRFVYVGFGRHPMLFQFGPVEIVFVYILWQSTSHTLNDPHDPLFTNVLKFKSLGQTLNVLNNALVGAQRLYAVYLTVDANDCIQK